jgi:glyoxylase-like metal-dependent hydrolase (beta-lactamase superfamily II)
MAPPVLTSCAPSVWRLEQAIPVAPVLPLRVRVNSYVLETEKGLCLLDCGSGGGYQALRGVVARAFPGVPVRRVYLTHGHFDHAGAGARCVNEGIEVWAAPQETALLSTGGPEGVPEAFRYPAFAPTHALSSPHTLGLRSGAALDLLPVPGHTAGSVALVSGQRDLFFGGDCLFGPLNGYAVTLGLELLTSLRQPAAERRHQLASIDLLREAVPSGALLLPGHGAPEPVTGSGAAFARSQRLLRWTLRLKR